jgi:hypothetical protein
MKKYVKPDAKELLLATEDIMTTSITLQGGRILTTWIRPTA